MKNIKQRIFNGLLISLLLLCNSSFLCGMKNKLNTNNLVLPNKRLKLNPNVTFELIQIKLDQLYKQAIPNLKIVDTFTLFSNKNLTHSNEELTALSKYFAQLPAHEQLIELSKYNNQRQQIVDDLQEKRRACLLALPAEEALQRIQKEEQQLILQFDQNQIDAQKELKLAYNIDENSSSWQNRMRELNAHAHFNLKILKESWDNTTWCINTPPNFAYALIDQMQEKGLDISAVEVQSLPDNKLYVSAGAHGPLSTMEYNKIGDKYRLDLKKHTPALFRYNPNLIEKNDLVIKQLVAHELNHILQSDTEFTNGTVKAISYCAKVDADKVCKHPAYVKIRLAQEIYADAALSLQDRTKINDVIMYANNLYPESYNILAMLKTNDEVRKTIAAQK